MKSQKLQCQFKCGVASKRFNGKITIEAGFRRSKLEDQERVCRNVKENPKELATMFLGKCFS